MKIPIFDRLTSIQRKVIIAILIVLGFLCFAILLVHAVRHRQFSALIVLSYLLLPAYIMVVIGLFHNKLVLIGSLLAFSVATILDTLIAQIEPNVRLYGFCIIMPAFLYFTIASLVYLWHHRKEGVWQAALPLGIIVSCTIIVLSLTAILKPLDIYFLWRLKGYNEVINLIENDKIKFAYGMANLPEKYQYLSNNGLVEARQHNNVWSIFFYRSSGILVDGSGYLYRSDNSSPDSKDRCRNWHHLKYPNWFYCGGH